VSTRPLRLAASLAILAAACSSVPTASTIDFGSGQRLVVQVGDSLDNVGLASSVAVDGNGQPYISYFGFPAEVKEGQIPIPRPIGTAFLPAVLLSTVDDTGMWTQGAIEQTKPAAEPQGITVPFGPVTTDNFPLKQDDSNGTASVVASDGTVHTAWTMADGVDYGTTKLGSSATVTRVYNYGTSVSLAGPISAPGIALDGDGNPWIAFSVLGPSGLEVHAASLQGSKWNDQVVATQPPCGSCPEPGPTQIAFVGGRPVVLFGNVVKHEVDSATQQGSGWRTESLVTKSDGLGLSATAIENTLYASYYATNGTVDVTTVKGGTPTTTEAGPAEKPDPNDTGNDAPRTAVTADSTGATYVAWDGESGVTFVSAAKDSQTFNPIALGPSGSSSAHPALAASDAGVFLTWYDTVNQDLMMGQYADVQNLIVAQPQPSIVPSFGATGGAECGTDNKVVLDVVAQGLAFTPTCLVAQAGKPFTITMDNKDAGTQHDVSIFPSAEKLTEQDALLWSFSDPNPPGPSTVKYSSGPLPAGSYYFHCDYHPTTMNGTFAVVK
jgi:plastocyanin